MGVGDGNNFFPGWLVDAESLPTANGALLHLRFARNHDPRGAGHGPDPLQAPEEGVHGFAKLGQLHEMRNINHDGETGIPAQSVLGNIVGALGKAGARNSATEEFDEQGNRVPLVSAERQ